MDLTPTEQDRVLLHCTAQLARARRARGLKLNVPESIAIIADSVAEAARDGLSVAAAVEVGRTVLGADDVLPGVPDIVTLVMVEAVFDDGSRLVAVADPLAGAGGQASGGLGDQAPGAVLPTAASATIDGSPQADDVVTVTVVNTASVPVTVTSHFHFFEVNPRLRFDRRAAYGRRLNTHSGGVVRFDPGVPVTVELIGFRGERVVIGFAGLVDGPLDAPGALEAAMAKMRACGFADAEEGAGDA